MGKKFYKDVHVVALCLIVMPAQMPAVLFHILSIHNQETPYWLQCQDKNSIIVSLIDVISSVWNAT